MTASLLAYIQIAKPTGPTSTFVESSKLTSPSLLLHVNNAATSFWLAVPTQVADLKASLDPQQSPLLVSAHWQPALPPHLYIWQTSGLAPWVLSRVVTPCDHTQVQQRLRHGHRVICNREPWITSLGPTPVTCEGSNPSPPRTPPTDRETSGRLSRRGSSPFVCLPSIAFFKAVQSIPHSMHCLCPPPVSW